MKEEEKELVNAIIVENGTVEDCVMAVLLRRLFTSPLSPVRTVEYNSVYSALVINTGAQVRDYIAIEWDNGTREGR